MIDLIILFSLIKRELTMYGISKNISEHFDAYTKPSFGAIKPALKRLEKSGFIKSRKSLSDGGKQSGFYQITTNGESEIKKLILDNLSDNPLQFFSNARIKLACAEILNKEQRSDLFQQLKLKALEHNFSAENILNDTYTSLSFYERITLDNTLCEYKNFITLIENLEKENKNS